MTHHSVILATSYFPPIEYFVHISQSNHVFIESHESYSKQSFRNRCYISGSNQIMPLSIPISRGQKKLKDIKISYHDNWNLVHWRSIESYYNASPFFLYYKDDIEPFFSGKFNFLLELNNEILYKILELIPLKTEINLTKSFENNYAEYTDLRYNIHPKIDQPEKSFLINYPGYHQVFETRFGFLPNLSILDLLFNEGPNTLEYLLSCKITKRITPNNE
ncbi:WbqC family protein [candidate division KSB1 bacterium]